MVAPDDLCGDASADGLASAGAGAPGAASGRAGAVQGVRATSSEAADGARRRKSIIPAEQVPVSVLDEGGADDHEWSEEDDLGQDGQSYDEVGNSFGNVLVYFADRNDVSLLRSLLFSPLRSFSKSKYWKNPDEVQTLSSCTMCVFSSPGRSQLLRLISQEGADLMDIDPSGSSAVAVASLAGTALTVASAFGDMGDWKHLSSFLLFQACVGGHLEVARALLREPGVRTDLPLGRWGTSCLLNCGDCRALIDALLAHPSTNVNCRCPQMAHCTPLIFAAGGNPCGFVFPDLLDALMAHAEVDLHAVDDWGWDALRYVRARCDTSMEATLLACAYGHHPLQ